MGQGFVWIIRNCALVADVVPRMVVRNKLSSMAPLHQWKESLPAFLKEVSLDHSFFCSTRRMFHWSPPSLECTATWMTVNCICPRVQCLQERRYRWSSTVLPRWTDGCRPIASNSTRTRPNSSGWVVVNSFSRSKSISFNLAPVRFRSSRQSTTMEWSSPVNYSCGSMFAMSAVQASTSCVSFVLFEGHLPSRHQSSLYMLLSTADWITATISRLRFGHLYLLAYLFMDWSSLIYLFS